MLDQIKISRRIILFATLATLATSPLHLQAQVPAEITTLARRAAESVAKVHPQQILVSPLQGCLLDPQICEGLDGALRSALESVLPGTRILGQADVIGYLKMHGLLTIDAYNVEALQIGSAEAGARVLVAEDLQWTEEANNVSIQLFDTPKRLKLSEFKISVLRHDPTSDDAPVILKDPEAGDSVVIPKKRGARPMYLPSCKSCPTPPYTEDERKRRLEGIVVLLATITEQGVADHIAVLKTFDDSMTRQSVDAVRGWKFNPAIGPDGRPFAVRVPIEVTYRLLK